MTASTQVAALASIGDNNLEAIKDIGPKFARALHQIDVHDVSTLARYTPDRLSQALSEGAEVSVSPQRIANKDWIGQARALAEAEKPQLAPPLENPGVGQDPDRPQDDPSWCEQAMFTLWFGYATGEDESQIWQARIYHESSGEQEAIELKEPIAKEDSEEVVTVPWVNWILERAKLPSRFQPVSVKTRAGVPSAAKIAHDLSLEILHVDTFELEPFAGLCGKRLGAHVRFWISGSEAKALAVDRAAFWVQVHTENLENGTVSLVTSRRGQLEPEKLDYLDELTFPIPELGRYRLQTLVLLLPPVGTMALYEGPTFRVKP